MAEPISTVAAICGATVALCAMVRTGMLLFYRKHRDDEKKRETERNRVVGLLEDIEKSLAQAVKEMRGGSDNLSGACGKLEGYVMQLQDPTVAEWMEGATKTRTINDMSDYLRKAFDIEGVALALGKETDGKEDLLSEMDAAVEQCRATINVLKAMR